MRTGSSYRMAIGKEFAFNSGSTADAGAVAFTALKVVYDTLEVNFAPEILETGFKTNSAIPNACQNAQGNRTGTITLSGTLTDNHELLLSGITHDATSPYSWTAKPTSGTFVIFRIWNSAATTPYNVDKFAGCRCDNVVFTGQSNGLIQFTATFTPASYTPNTTQAITGTDPGHPCLTPFNFGDVTYAGSFGNTTTLKSFSLTMGTEYAENAASFQNSNTRLADAVLNYTGEINVVTNHVEGNANDYTVENIGSNYFTGRDELITFANANKTWAFALPIQLTALTNPDPGMQLFETNATGRLVVDSIDGITVPAITVTAV